MTSCWQDHTQSINQNLYSAPSRSLLRGTLDPGQAEKNSLEKRWNWERAPFGRCLRGAL